jgi:SOS-response transcriptional repressor LexA
MPDPYNPIIAMEKIRRLRPFRHPTPEPDVALVLFRGGHPLVTLWPGDRLSAMKIIWGNYKIIYEVDITEHWFGFDCTLPCKGDAFHFHAEVRVVYSVDDPATIVRRKAINACEDLTPLVIQTMRRISRNHDVEEIDAAERTITEAVERGAYDVGFKVNRCVVSLSLEEDARAYIRKLRQIERDKERERREAELQRQRDELELERMRVKMDFYSPLIREGHWQLLALQLTNHPEDVATVAQMLSQQRQAEMEHRLEVLKVMLDKGALEDFDVEEAGKRVLQRLVESLALEPGARALDSETERKALPVQEEQTSETENIKVELGNKTEIGSAPKDVQDDLQAEESPHQRPISISAGRLQSEKGELRKVPLMTSLSTAGADPLDANNIEAYIPVTVPDVEFALRVQKDDLSQLGISAGDVLLVGRQDMVKNGDLSVVKVIHQHAKAEILIRKVFFDKYRLRFVDGCPGSHPVIFTRKEAKEHVRTFGKVLGVIQGSDIRTDEIVSTREVAKVLPIN